MVKIESVVKEGVPPKNQIVEKFATLITSAFGLVAALAWNDAIKGVLQNLDLIKYGPIIYAIIVTVLAVLLTYWIGKVSVKFNKE